MMLLASSAFCQDYQWSYTKHTREATRILKQQPSSERKKELIQLITENQLILITQEEFDLELKSIEAFRKGEANYDVYLKENLNAVRGKYFVIEGWFNINE